MRWSFLKDRLRPFGKFSRPLRGSVCGRVFAPKAGWGGAACGGSSWEWGDVVAAGFGVPVHWSVWWRCDVLRVASTPLGDGVVVRVTHDAQLSCP